MNQRIRDKLNGVNDEVIIRALRTGKYTDQFTKTYATPEETKANLDRLPKCMQKRGEPDAN